MKNLYLVRHANTQPSIDNDKERILTPKGVKEINSIAHQILQQDFNIDTVLCSTSIRTKQTIHHLESFLDKNFYIEYKENLYNPTIADFLSNIQTTPTHFHNLMIVSHNPTISDIVNYILKNQNISFGTANIAKLELDISDWYELHDGCGKLKWLIKPEKI